MQTQLDAEKFIERFESQVDFEGGVDALRDQIIMSMIKGKLVFHDTAEEPAAVLLEAARRERQTYARQQQRESAGPLPELDPGSLPFELPSNWTWSRWGEFILDIEQSAPDAAKPGDFVIAKKSTEDRIGKSALVRDGDVKNGNGETTDDEVVMRVRMSEVVDPKFFHLTNNSPAGRGYYASQATSVDNGLKEIETQVVTHMPFPIPPRAEQGRIVAKVEKLMALCDELELRRKRRDENRIKSLQIAVHEALEEA